jgi:hypothetical protein
VWSGVRTGRRQPIERGRHNHRPSAAVKSPQTFMEVTTEYTKSAYETFAEATKIGDLYKEALKPVVPKNLNYY